MAEMADEILRHYHVNEERRRDKLRAQLADATQACEHWQQEIAALEQRVRDDGFQRERRSKCSSCRFVCL
jgi:hypothetical protein